MKDSKVYMKQRGKSLGKSFVIYMILLLIARSSSFIREIILADKYGANDITDAYSIALTITTTLFGGVGTAIYTSYIPMYYSLKKKGKKRLDQFNGNLSIGVILISLVLIGMVYLFPQMIVTFFASGFNENTIDITVRFTKIVIWSLPFIGIAYIMQGYLQANNHVNLIAFMSFPISAACIWGIVASSSEKLFFLPLGVLLSNILLIIYFGLPAIKYGFRQSFVYRKGDKDIKQLVRLALPAFWGQMVMEINVIIDKNLASTLQRGTITTLSRGYQMAIIIESLIGASIATIIYPHFSKCIEKKSTEELKRMICRGVFIVIITIIPIAISMFILSKPITEVLFGRGKGSNYSIYLTYTALAAYVIGMIPLSVRVVIEKVFYAMKDTKTPVWNSTIGILVNIILDLILIRIWGHIGLAVASTVSVLVTTLLLLYNLYRKIGNYYLDKIGICFVGISIAGFIMGICEKELWEYIKELDYLEDILNRFMAVGIVCFFGIILFLMILFCIYKIYIVRKNHKFCLKKEDER